MTVRLSTPLSRAWLDRAVLTVAQMRAADGLAAATAGGSYALMEAAGGALADTLEREFPTAEGFDFLCGPGNNGGDGYVAASALVRRGRDVAVWVLAAPSAQDAQRAEQDFEGSKEPLSRFAPRAGRVTVDALLGAGLARPLEGEALAARKKVEAAGTDVVAVDLPSGLAGDTGKALGEAFRARLTVTFARLKPAHLLYPGRAMCGRIALADIGIGDEVLAQVGPTLFANDPALWRDAIPWPEGDTHKHRRGHLAVCSGPAGMTGAARLSAASGARAGAGAVTVLSPGEAMADNAAHLTAIMLRQVDDAAELEAFLDKGSIRALALGPGFGDLARARAFALAVLRRGGQEQPLPLVLDADGITAFRDDPGELFEAASGAVRLILTPHEGEFARLFPDVAGDDTLSKVEKARHAASRANAAIVLKGLDTVIAEPSGRAVVNTNATPFLATAGSGDILTGLCGGLLAQGMPAWLTACAAVWIHAEAGRRFGPGLTADDLPDALLPVLRDLAPAEL